jgi:hypothetical protein
LSFTNMSSEKVLGLLRVASPIGDKQPLIVMLQVEEPSERGPVGAPTWMLMSGKQGYPVCHCLRLLRPRSRCKDVGRFT